MLFGRKYFPRIIEYSVISVKKSAWMQCRLSADRRVSPVISTPQWSCIYRVKCMYWTLVVAIFDAGDMTLWMERQTCIKSVSIAISCSIHRCITFSAHSLSVSLHFSRARCFLIFFSLFKWKNVTHILSLFIVTVTIMASCRCRCRRWQCCCCCCGCCRRRRLQSHAKWITFSLLSESSRFFIVH